jgi:hypothetical protein
MAFVDSVDSQHVYFYKQLALDSKSVTKDLSTDVTIVILALLCTWEH